MGGYLASREVLTAADRRQINYASGRYSADVCISRSHPGDGHVRASLLVLRFGRPFLCSPRFLCCVSDVPSLCSPRPPARRSVAGGRNFSVTHPPLPCVLSGEGLLLRSRACAGLLFAFFYSLLSSRSRPTREGYFPQDWSSLPAGTPSGGRVGLRLELAWLDRAETPC